MFEYCFCMLDNVQIPLFIKFFFIEFICNLISNLIHDWLRKQEMTWDLVKQEKQNVSVLVKYSSPNIHHIFRIDFLCYILYIYIYTYEYSFILATRKWWWFIYSWYLFTESYLYKEKKMIIEYIHYYWKYLMGRKVVHLFFSFNYQKEENMRIS